MKILVSAYACEPYKGSEPGAGWNWSVGAAQNHDVWVLTRSNNREAIEAELERRRTPSLRFVYIDLPSAWTSWKRGSRGLRSYYLLWQVAALREARRLHEEIGFDVVHHVTFANVWLPALTCFVNTSFVLGPVGGGPHVRLRHYPKLGVRGAVRELSRESGRTLARVSPLTHASLRCADVILVQNEETMLAIPRRFRHRAAIRPNASIADDFPDYVERTPPTGSARKAVFAGRLLAWKGASIAIEAMRALDEWHLIIVGSGPEITRLMRLAERLGVWPRVDFVPWLGQSDLWQVIAKADVLALPSLRDDSPLIVAEAQALGIPVVAFDQGGPREFARYPSSTVDVVSLEGADLTRAFVHGLKRASRLDRRSKRDPYTIDSIATSLDAVYRTAVRSANRADRRRSPRDPSGAHIFDDAVGQGSSLPRLRD